ncbi:hypothetical protein Pla163_34780 [Planctomycetes bacterium Pla163]|uniref:Uncharacterized protein n=1 Tax=Rohdeia mirabilis TaxID=2528008 RepID=A0A518D4C1_9BACT|nr:hypothetical protein Pla163_34780 [Planctomycetes bacterium Pla163]
MPGRSKLAPEHAGDLIPAFRQALEREIKRGKAGPGKRKGRGKASRPPESADLDVAG